MSLMLETAIACAQRVDLAASSSLVAASRVTVTAVAVVLVSGKDIERAREVETRVGVSLMIPRRQLGK